MRRLLVLLLLSLSSGVLLFLSDYPVHAWPLQLVALLPWLFGLERLCASRRAALLAGLLLGLGNTLPLLLVLEFPLLMGGPLALYLSLLWMLISLGIYLVRGARTPWFPLAAGAVAAVVEWVDFTLLPVWGTAQSFVRVWSAWPFAAQVVALGGVTGLVFLVVSGQALIGRLLWGERRSRAVIGLTLLLGVWLGWSGWSWTRPARGELQVAVMGWTAGDLARRGLAPAGATADPLRLFDELYRPLANQAARHGAELVVSPEVGFFVERAEKAPLEHRASGLAREAGLALVIGIFDRESNSNQALFFDRQGRQQPGYRKTHLIPMIERYQAGDGTVPLWSLSRRSSPAVAMAGMICQDDNFTDLARAQGRRGVQLVAVPTNDWQQVKDYHLESSIFRAVENRYAVLRAASNGVSAIISPRGQVLARKDHFAEGAGLLVARVPLRGGPTLYSRFGDWPAAASLLLLVAVWLGERRRRRGREQAAAP